MKPVTMGPKDTSPQWFLSSFSWTLVVLVVVTSVSCSGHRLNCSEPDQPTLLRALDHVFNLKAIRPVMNMTTRTSVNTYFTLYGILGVDEKAQLLKTYIWLSFWWMNEFISWDPIQCGTNKISLPRDQFWVPDIVINEFMDENKAPFVPYVYLYSDGKVFDSVPVKVVSSCNLDIYTFPFDIQNCTLSFNSYIHKARDIKMKLGVPIDNITERSKNVMTTLGEWELLDITYHDYSMSDSDDSKTIDEIAFHIRVRRRATLYVVNLLLPSCFLITVDLFSFLLPPQNVDRSSFKMTLILGYTVFLLIMNDLLPITGNTLPLLNVFFSLCLALMVASLLETILITNLLHSSADLPPIPRWMHFLILQMIGYLVCLRWKPKEPRGADTKMHEVVAETEAGEKVKTPGEVQVTGEVQAPEKVQAPEDHQALEELRSLGKDLQAIRLLVEKHQGGSQSSEEWIQVGFIIDRLLFGLYILFISVSFITIIIIWVNSYNQ